MPGSFNRTRFSGKDKARKRVIKLRGRSGRVVVSYTGTQDFEHIAKQLDAFVYEPKRKEEIKKKYESLKKYIKVYD